MKRFLFALGLWGTVCLTSAALAEISGTVREVSGRKATIEISGEHPRAGDKAEIFFKLAGTDDEISVASGKVIREEATTVEVEVESATGEVAKDQLVRFTPGNKEATTSSPVISPTKPPVVVTAPTPAETPTEVAEATPSRTLPPSVPFPTMAPKGATQVDSSEESAAAPCLNNGIAQYSAGNINGAIASYTEGIRVAPSVAVLYLNRANVYLYKPNFNAAVADANKALELNVSKGDDAYNIRATAKAGLGNYDSAIADCNRAIKINPGNALAYNNRANNRVRKRDYKGALADCNKSISLDPSSGLPYYNRGFAYYNLGNASSALSDWKKAVAKQPSFGAELNPKIAQLEAQGAQARPAPPPPPTSTNSAPGPGDWVDLTNAAQKMVGTWTCQGTRTHFAADGTFVSNPYRGQWQVQGDRLVQYFPQTNQTLTNQLLSISSKSFVLRTPDGRTLRFTKAK